MAHGSLTRGEVRKALKKLRELKIKPPRVGYCVTVIGRDPAKTNASSSIHYNPGGPVELCRHPKSRYIPNDTGYQIVTHRRDHGLFGSHKPTIYEALRSKLNREPTNPELKAEVSRIKNEGYVQAATQGKLRHQRRR